MKHFNIIFICVYRCFFAPQIFHICIRNNLLIVCLCFQKEQGRVISSYLQGNTMKYSRNIFAVDRLFVSPGWFDESSGFLEIPSEQLSVLINNLLGFFKDCQVFLFWENPMLSSAN